jgi:hypothetical protein
MAKKQATTGGPRKRVLSQADFEQREKRLSKAERRDQRLRWILWAVGVVAAVGFILFIFALFNDTLVVPREDLTTVNGQGYPVADFQNRVQYERYALAAQMRTYYNNAREAGLTADEARDNTLFIFGGQGQEGSAGSIGVLLNPELFGQEVLRQVEDELIIAQAAEQFGVTAQVDEAAVQAEIDRLASLLTGRGLEQTPSPTASLTPSLTITPFITATITPTPSDTPTQTATLQPTAEGCAEGDAACPTVTPLPTQTSTQTPTATPETTETPTATPTEITQDEAASTVVAFRGNFLEEGQDESGFSEADLRQVFYYDALRDALADHITSEAEGPLAEYYVNPVDIFVDTRHILIGFPQGETVPEGDDNEYYARALAISQSLQAGEPFAPLAQAVSTDLGSGANGGSLGWSSSTGYVEGFREVVETMPIGEISGPVRSQFGYHIIQVMDRESRPFDEARLDSLQEAAFTRWLDQRRAETPVIRREGWQEFIPTNPNYEDLLGDILPLDQ